MKVAHFYTALSFLITTTSTVNALVAGSVGPICPAAEVCGGKNTVDLGVLDNHRRRHVAPRSHAKRETNAERFARGEPPLRPTRRYTGARVARAIPSGTPTTNYRGYLQVQQDSDNSVLGYISKAALSGIQFQYDADIANALIVDFTAPIAAGITTEIEVSMENQDTAYPFLSLIQGRDDVDSTIQPTSYQYGYIGGSAHTAEGATPQNVANTYTSLARTAESSVWTFDSVTNGIAHQWINPDGSSPVTFAFIQSGALYFGGDPAAFQVRYPAAITNIHYVFVAI